MSITVTSTTDSAETVNAVMGKTAESEAAKGATASAPEAEKASEQKESTDSEPAEKEETESEAEESESEEEAETPEAGKPKRKSGIQRRVDKLNARVSAAQADAEYWRRRALEGATAPKDAPKAEAAQPVATEGEPTADSFDNHADFVRAVARWETKQELKAEAAKQQKKSQESEHEERLKTFNDRLADFKSKTPDFDEVDSDLTEVLASQRVTVSPTLHEIFTTSENGPELAYVLAKDPTEFVRLCKLGPVAAAREIGKLETRIAAQSSPEKKTEPKKITNASKPLAPVNASKGSAEKDPETMDYQQYKRWREAQLKKR